MAAENSENQRAAENSSRQDAAAQTERAENHGLPATRPRVFFKSITFQDGSQFNFGNNDIVVFVGGNNAGKSQTLKDLQSLLKGEFSKTKAVKDAPTGKIGTGESLQSFIRKNAKREADSYHTIYKGYGFSLGYGSRNDNFVKEQWEHNKISYFADIFCRLTKTETRITDSNASNSFDALAEAPSNPIQFLHENTPIEKRINAFFQKSFEKELVLEKGAGNIIPLLVGSDVPLEGDEDRTSSTYRKRLHGSASPLQEQGDGMRNFAGVILQTLADPIPSILLLDEPEAFLHPPQAKILGRLLATERPRDAQLFIATHSVDILMGLLEAAPDNLHIIRLDRNSDKYAVELDKDKAKRIMDDPFLRHSKILSGLFYKRVIICEAESDCLFYQVILEAMAMAGVSDALFIPAGGKDKLYKLAAVLKALHIPVAVIADLDILNNGGGTFEPTIKTLGDEAAWAAIEPLWNSVKSAIEGQKGLKTAEQIEQDIQNALKKLKNKKAGFPEEIDKEIRNSLKNASPWGNVRTSGKSAIPRGEAMETWQKLQKACAQMNLWIVPAGELESFCQTAKGHGSEWVHDVLTSKDLNAKELQEARDFISAVWDNKPENLN